MKKWLIRACLVLLCVSLFCGIVGADAEVTLDITYLPIEGNGFVADTLHGVPALYNETGPVLYCSELVERYYAEVYGLQVCLPGAPIVVGNDTYWFEKTTQPMTGDVAYASASARERDYGHYALVKYADENTDTVTLIEQNWGWNGCAGFNRVIPYDGACYTFYRLCSRNGRSQPKLQQQDTVSSWAKEYVQFADSCGITKNLLAGFQRAISREEIAKLAVNTLSYFGIRAWSDDPCKAACELRIMSVDTNGQFRPNETVTRQMAATVLARVYALIEQLPEENLSVLNAYADRRAISDWAAGPVSVMTQLGLMSGSNGNFCPNDDITTEQVITVMVRIVRNQM